MAGSVIAALAGCGQRLDSNDGGTPTYGGALTFYDPVQYDAWKPTNSLWSNSQVANNIAERLIWQDPKTGEYKPWLAESWTTSDDGLSYTFTLKDGVTFSDGTPLDSAVVKRNFDQHGIGDENRGITKDPFWLNYAGTDTPDAKTVVVRLTEPNAAFLQLFSNYRASSILANSFLDRDLNGQSDLKNWVGTGPFVVDSVDGTNGVTLTRRDDYDWAPGGSTHQGKAYLDKVVFKTVAEGGTRVGALTTGDAQIARNIAPYDEETVSAGGGEILAVPVQGETNDLTATLNEDSPIRDKQVRLALQAATDRKAINETALSPSYPIPTSALVKGTPLRADSSRFLGYDLDKAKDLLDEAGWKVGSDGIRSKNGQRLSLPLRVAPYYQVSQSVLEVLQSQWRKAGVEITLTSPSLTEYESQLATGKNWYLTQGQNSTAEPGVLAITYGSDQQNSLKNPVPDAKLDSLIAAQAAERDPAERKSRIADLETYIFEQGYSIPLYDETQVFALAPSVHGFGTESTARSWFYDTWLTSGGN
ncbi:ABC transporter substrate-binding protein [Gordonia humi]|uniref:Peptide/nickel transport system substrate-binding protein n=1 Tax=Gordonia humi TaxID=686429 RepID=A0A840F798_9ACTN|nr:peptide/nickel transport system substrate-binding protein [Gordonia humi]